MILAVAAGALRRFFERRGEKRAPSRSSALVPMSDPPPEEAHELGNRIATLMVAAAASASATRAAARDDPRDDDAAQVVRAGAGGVAGDRGDRLDAADDEPGPRRARWLRPLTWNLVISNVPGPQMPFYLLGGQMRAIYPFVPLSPQGHALSIGIVCYDGGVFFGLAGDRDVGSPTSTSSRSRSSRRSRSRPLERGRHDRRDGARLRRSLRVPATGGRGRRGRPRLAGRRARPRRPHGRRRRPGRRRLRRRHRRDLRASDAQRDRGDRPARGRGADRGDPQRRADERLSQLFRTASGADGYTRRAAPVYPMAAAGSFFDRVVPDRHRGIAMCSNAAHWLREHPELATPGTMYFAGASADARAELAASAAADWLALRGARRGAQSRRRPTRPGDLDDRRRRHRARLGRPAPRADVDVAAALAADGLLDAEALERYVFPSTAARARRRQLVPDELRCCARPSTRSPTVLGAARGDPRPGGLRPRLHRVRPRLRGIDDAHLPVRARRPGDRAAALADEFFTRFEAATAADPERGRYECWILRLALRRR